MSDVTPTKDKPGQRLFDWQMLADTAGNTSDYLVVENGPNGSLREFIHQLDIVPAKFILFSDLPVGMTKGDLTTLLEDAITGVTLSVDGINAVASPIVARSLPLALTLDAVRAVEVLTASGAGAATLADITVPGAGKKLQITFPEVPEAATFTGLTELVFHHAETMTTPAFATGAQTIVPFASVASAFTKAEFSGAYSVSTGYFTVPSGQAGRYLLVANIRFDLGTFANVHAGYNWDFGFRSSGGLISYSSGTDHSTAAGLSCSFVLNLAEGDTVAPYFFHENGATGTNPSARYLNFAAFKVRPS